MADCARGKECGAAAEGLEHFCSGKPFSALPEQCWRKGQMLDLAIVGGGPGGLMTAWYLRKKLGPLCKVTIFEATERLGGKILSKKFEVRAGAVRGGRRRNLRLFDARPRSLARSGAASGSADYPDRRRAGATRRRASGRRARHAPQIRRKRPTTPSRRSASAAQR